MANDPSWNFQDPASKDVLLGVVRREMDQMLELASDKARWEAPTACAEWQVRDVIGHLVDTTEGYLPAFELARSGGQAPDPLGLRVMAQRVDEGAKSFRKVPQDELLDRLHDDARKMMAEFEALSDDGAGRDPWFLTSTWGPFPRCSTRCSSSSTTRFTRGTYVRGPASPTRSTATPPTCSCRSSSCSGRRPRMPRSVGEAYSVGIRTTGQQRWRDAGRCLQ